MRSRDCTTPMNGCETAVPPCVRPKAANSIIILDLGLPQLDGMDVLQRLCSGGNATPVLIFSARDAPRDRIVGLNAGADDYLVKPFELEELLARIHVIERRRSGGSTNHAASR